MSIRVPCARGARTGLVLWALLSCSHALGQPAPDGYDELIAQAVREFDTRNFAEARALFSKAHALRPNARTLRGIGITEFELRNYVDSVARLEEALASPVRPLEGELRAQTEASLARARTFVGRVELQTLPAQAAARVKVDGAEVERAPDRALTLAIGEHVVAVEANGYAEATRALSIKGGEQLRLTIELQALGSRPAPALATRSVAHERERDADGGDSVWSSPWLWTAVGVVRVGGAVTSVLLLNDGDDGGAPSPLPGDIGGVVQTLRVR